MKIAYITMQFPVPSETFAGSDVLALLARDESVTVFTLRPPHPDAEALIRQRSLDDVDVRQQTARRTARGVSLVLRRPGWALALLAFIVRWTYRRPRQTLASLALLPGALVVFDDVVREEFDVVHLFWGHYPALVAHLAQRFAPRTVRSVFLGAYDLLANFGGSAPVARDADVVWTHVAANRDAIAQLGVAPEKIHVAYRGVRVADLEQVREAAAGERSPLGLISVGRLVELKRMDALVGAFAQLRKRVPDATLTIVGDGPQRAALENLAERLGVARAVTFTGHLPHVEALRLVARATAFVLLSSTERLPNAVKEAMALGTICVVSDTPGIDELVRDGQTGYVVDDVGATTVAGAIERVLTDSEDIARVRRAAELRIREAFDVEPTMDLYRRTWAARLP